MASVLFIRLRMHLFFLEEIDSLNVGAQSQWKTGSYLEITTTAQNSPFLTLNNKTVFFYFTGNLFLRYVQITYAENLTLKMSFFCVHFFFNVIFLPHLVLNLENRTCAEQKTL